MWPSLHTADQLFAISNLALIIGLTLTVVATVGAVWMANVREGYLKRELSEAHARLAGLGVATAEANAAAEKARENAAMAQERAALLEKEALQARMRTIQLQNAYRELERKSRKAPF